MENVATEEFISRTEALKDFEENNARNPNWTPQRVKTLLLRQPAADVAEVVHGRWLLHHTVTGNPYTECSNCCTDFAFKTDKGTFAKLDMRDMPYCPFCSAKMDGGNDDAPD